MIRTISGIRILLVIAAGLAATLPFPLSGPAAAQPASGSGNAPTGLSGSPHDFDWEIGSWTCRLRRLVHPLTGSHTWVSYEGTSIVRKIWGGKANLGELEVTGGGQHIEGMTLRLYQPQGHEWSIYWAGSVDGELTSPMIGGFSNGHGEFYDQESYQGRAIFVRFIFSKFSRTSFELDQAFSDDGGKTWETNWIADFAKMP